MVLPDGGVLFVLGELEPGRFFDLAVGDHVEVVQTVDLTGVALVRATLSLRAPASLPPDRAWEASLVVDGAKRAALRAGSGRVRTTSDLAANVSKLAGAHEVGLRLELVAS